MNQLDPNAVANARYRMDARLEEARLRRSILDTQRLDSESSTARWSPRWEKGLVTRLATRLRSQERADTIEAPVSGRDDDSIEPSQTWLEPEIVVVDTESVQPSDLESEPEIARSGQAAPVKTA